MSTNGTLEGLLYILCLFVWFFLFVFCLFFGEVCFLGRFVVGFFGGQVPGSPFLDLPLMCFNFAIFRVRFHLQNKR